MENFTKGPWRVSLCGTKRIPIIQRGMSGGFYVADDDYERAMADAYLTGAAPEMYEFIKSIQLDSVEDEIKRDQLLARARGEE